MGFNSAFKELKGERKNEVNLASPCSAEVKIWWSYTSTPTCLYAVDRENYGTKITAFILKKLTSERC